MDRQTGRKTDGQTDRQVDRRSVLAEGDHPQVRPPAAPGEPITGSSAPPAGRSRQHSPSVFIGKVSWPLSRYTLWDGRAEISLLS